MVVATVCADGDRANVFLATSGVVLIARVRRGMVHWAMEWGLLASLTVPERRLVLARTHRHRYAKGETLFHEGDLAETVHLVEQGRVVSRRTTPQGDVVTYAVLGPGEAFGEMAMVADDHRRSSTIVALEPVVTLTLRFDEFRRLCDEHPGVQTLLVTMLARRVDRLSTHLMNALYMPVDRRLLRTLVDLSTHYGADAGSGEVSLPLTQVDVGELAGASRPTTNRVLRRLEREGLVRLHRGHVTLLDVSALREKA